MEENIKKKIILGVVGITVLLIVLITATYAWFSARSEDESQQITTAKVDLVVEVNPDATHITNIKPTTWDAEDMANNNDNKDIVQIPIKVTNNSTIDVKYYLRLLAEGLELNNDETLTGGNLSEIKYILYELDDVNKEIARGDFTEPEKEQIIIRKKAIKKDEIQNYKLYLYIEETEEIQNRLQGLNFNIIINGDIKTNYEIEELEYIESTGTQYIDTKYYPNGNSSYSFKYSDNRISGVMFGAYNTSWNDGSGLYIKGSGTNPFLHYYSNVSISAGYHSEGIIDINRGTFVLDGTEYLSLPYKNFSVDFPLYIFAGNWGGQELEQPTEYRLYYFKIYDNDVLVRDFVPSYNTVTMIDADGNECPKGTIGLYDRVEEKFYTNKGAESFLKGPEI